MRGLGEAYGRVDGIGEEVYTSRIKVLCKKMSTDLLSKISPGRLDWQIYVCISRLWEYRGPTGDGDVYHLDLVIVDEQNNAMYVEIPADLISQFKEHVAEGEVVKIKKFLVQNAKPAFRVVEADCMIRFTKYTHMDKVVPKPKNFPRFVYNLVPFSDLPSHVNSTARFLDVIGYVTAISNVTKVFSGNKLQLRRNITLKYQKYVSSYASI